MCINAKRLEQGCFACLWLDAGQVAVLLERENRCLHDRLRHLVEMAGQTEDSEEVTVVERRFVILKDQRKKYRCACNGCVDTAPGPLKLQPASRYSPAFAVEEAVCKYLDHLPLEEVGLVPPVRLRDVRLANRLRLAVDARRGLPLERQVGRPQPAPRLNAEIMRVLRSISLVRD